MSTTDDRQVLAGLLLVDLSAGIGGAYTAKLLTDAGATAVRVEPPAGAALRGCELRGNDAPLFGYLDAGKQSVTLDDDVERLLAAADVIVSDAGDGNALGERYPDAIVVSHTAFGLDGPWRDRPASDLTLQALSGSIGGRGEIDHPPTAAGGELASWIGGAAAAVAVLMAWRAGTGTVIDMSELETAVAIYNGFQTVAYELTGVPSPTPARVSELPSIERAKDGWVGFCTLSAQQFAAFADMIGRPEWVADPDISRIDWRSRHAATLRPEIEAWTMTHSVEEIVADAAARRLPCAPVGNGEVLTTIGQLVARNCFERDGTGSFQQPRPPARLSRVVTRTPRPPAVIGSSSVDDVLSARIDERPPHPVAWPLPLSGLRVFDLTSFWAGPAASQILASFGADVIKVESIQRPDGTRLGTSYGVVGERAWERAPLFHGCNTGKRGITLDLTRPEGQAVARRLLQDCDVLIENYTPRVAERFGLLDSPRDDVIVVRMPAWGLDGPWRDRPGFAQTMEQVTGIGWVTGRADGPPLVPRGPCDPNGAYHAAFATMLAVLDRDRTGRGQVVESALVDAALAVAAEQVVEYTATGTLIGRIGNRSRRHAPQGVYAAAGVEQWVAVAVTDDDGWRALSGVLGRADLVDDPALATADQRRERHDELDEVIASWCASRAAGEAADQLRAVGVPAEVVVAPRDVGANIHLRERGYLEAVEHPVVGTVRLPRFPARLRGRPGPFHLRPAPTLGQDTRGVLAELAGVTEDEYAELERDGLVGEAPA